MPSRNHYPDRSQKFAFGKSEVIQFLMRECNCGEAEAVKLFERARRSKNILFDPVSKCWMGRETFKEQFPNA